MKIARNDPALAHALTRHSVVSGGARRSQRLDALLGRGPVSVAKLSRAIQLAYGPMMVSERIKRLLGSRAAGEWIVLSYDEEGGIGPAHIRCDRLGLRECPLRLRFMPHALARLAQRTLGVADMTAIAPVLAFHLLAVLRHLDPAKHLQFRSVSREGVFLWKRDDDVFVAGTWISADSAADPEVRRVCEQADSARSVDK
jgi:hypothetical protein